MLANGEIAVVQLLRHRVQAGVVIEVDERALLVLHLVQRRGLLELAAQVGEFVISPNLLQSKRFPLLLVPAVVEVQAAGILAAVRLGFALLSLHFGSLGVLRGDGFLLGLVEFGGRDEDWQV